MKGFPAQRVHGHVQRTIGSHMRLGSCGDDRQRVERHELGGSTVAEKFGKSGRDAEPREGTGPGGDAQESNVAATQTAFFQLRLNRLMQPRCRSKRVRKLVRSNRLPRLGQRDTGVS